MVKGTVDLVEKFDRLAPDFSRREYGGDPARYYRRRAESILRQGPRLEAGETVLDLGCGDGLLAVPLLAAGLRYAGVDQSPQMIETARAALGHRVALDVGDIFAYAPPEPVAASTCFRAVYYAKDMRGFFAHVRSYTTKKFVFDFGLRDFSRSEIVADLRAAGFGDLDIRPFLYPQHFAPPPGVDTLLRAAERTGPLVYPLLKLRFTYIVAASPR